MAIKTKSIKRQIVKKMLKWLLFSVLIALLPIMFNWIILVSRSSPSSLQDVIKQGELLLVIAALTASGLGEIIASGSYMAIGKIFASGGCVIILIFASLYYSYVSTTNYVLDSSIVSLTSLWLYVFAVISSGSCVALAEFKS